MNTITAMIASTSRIVMRVELFMRPTILRPRAARKITPATPKGHTMSSLVTMRMNDVSIHARSTSSLLDWREGDQVALTCSDMSKVDGYGMCGTHEDLRRLRDRITSYLGDGGAISVAYSSGIVDSLTSALLGLKGFIVELSYKDGTVKEVLVRNFNEDRNELIVLDFYEATDSVGRTPYGVDLDLLARILVV